MSSNVVEGCVRNAITGVPRILIPVFVLLIMAGCSGNAPQASTTPSPNILPTREPSPTPLPDQSAFRAAWEAGPHAHTYDLGKGPNTYCSRCHSPQNWDPASAVDLPPNCVTCKFPTDPELRIATTMDFVEEQDWVGIDCATCHEMERGVALPGFAWLNTVTGQYEVVNTPDELCAKCHLTTAGVSASGGRGVTHAIDARGSAHANWAGEWPQADRPQYWTDCHEPHSTEPLQCLDCHPGIPSSTTHTFGLNASMLDKVECMACHDASGMEVGPSPDPEQNGVFVTLVSSVGRDGQKSTSFSYSHTIQWQVACDRCHFAGNEWELPVLSAAGQPVTEE
ncbi:MAG: cytochrome c3 family protein [Anaerolineales bacterium]